MPVWKLFVVMFGGMLVAGNYMFVTECGTVRCHEICKGYSRPFFIELDPWLSQIETVQGQEKAASKRHCKRWSAGNEPERGLVATRIVPTFRHIQRSLRHAGCGKTSSASDPPLVIHKPLSWWVMMRCLVFACHVQGRAAVPMVNFHYCCMAWNRIKQRTHVWP